jgi:adenine-specific DNA-methyltransferase
MTPIPQGRVHGAPNEELRDPPTKRKLLGSFYTPPQVADYLSAWAIRSPDDVVLEPAAGDGVFLEAAAERFRALGATSLESKLIGVEIDAREARRARDRVPGSDVRTGSFLDLGPRELPNATVVLGNPPFIRYQVLASEVRRQSASRASLQGVDISLLASSWAHFVVHAVSFLEPKYGRLALVLPAELLHSDYGRAIREFLARRFRSLTTIVFDSPIFSDAHVDALLLLADQQGPRGRHSLRVSGAAALSALTVPKLRPEPFDLRWHIGVDRAIARMYGELVEAGSAFRLGSVASVDIGIVTGADGFFILSAADIARLRLSETNTSRVVAGPRDVRGLSLRRSETRWLLNLPRDSVIPTGSHLARYLAHGKHDLRLTDRHKVGRREPWYTVPMPRLKPQLLLPYMSHGSPRLVANNIGARATNLIHSVGLTSRDINARVLAAASLSWICSLSAEIEGRVYGGGVLKLEPRDAERLLVPDVRGRENDIAAIFPKLDRLIRSGRRAEASDLVDKTLDLETKAFKDYSLAMRARRHGLRKRKSAPEG